jgi:hypothetical protein
MAIEFLLVTFPDQRAVLADGAGVGFTNHILMLPGDEYEIMLEGNSCAPASQVITLAGTSIIKPMVVAFDLVTAAADALNSVPTPMEADSTEAMTSVAKRSRAPNLSNANTRSKASTRPTNTISDAAAVNTGKQAKKNA